MKDKRRLIPLLSGIVITAIWIGTLLGVHLVIISVFDIPSADNLPIMAFAVLIILPLYFLGWLSYCEQGERVGTDMPNSVDPNCVPSYGLLNRVIDIALIMISLLLLFYGMDRTFSSHSYLIGVPMMICGEILFFVFSWRISKIALRISRQI